MKGKAKPIFTVLLLIGLLAVMYGSLNIKDHSIREVYKDVTFMRITMEARGYISQIEYGMKNGRQLDNFYNMQETLLGIQGCSSYMEGAYVVSASGKLLYQNGVKADKLSLTIPQNPVYPKGKLYTLQEDEKYYYLAVPIENGSGQIEGYLLMCIGKNAVDNAVSDYNNQNRIQTLVIGLEIFGMAVFLIRRIRPNKKKQMAFRLALLLSIAVTTTAVLDSGLVIARFYQIVSDTTLQSANKMAQALQSDVDSVVAKGVSLERIYDLNGWLAKNSSELTIVKSLTLDRNRKITATVSRTYIYSFFNRFLLRTALLVLVCILCSAVCCVITALLCSNRMSARKFDIMKGVAHA